MKLRPQIAAIALPAIAANITTPLLGLVDVAITGHIGASLYIAAIAVGGAMFNMLYWLVNFLRMGTSGLTAQAFGANDKQLQTLTLCRSMAAGLALGFVMLIMQNPVSDIVLTFMDADDAAAALARQYFHICIWGAPAVTAGYALSGWLLGMQNSKAQMYMAIITNLVNIAVSATLVFALNAGMKGVAFGTMTAQWVGLIFGCAYIALRYRPKMPALKAVFEVRPLIRFFRINGDIFLRTTCLVAVTLWFTHAGAKQGTDILAANALLMQLFMLFSFFMDGFAFAGEALAGKFIGAKQTSGLHKLVKTLIRIGFACALFFSTLYLIAGEWFLTILTSDPNAVRVASLYLPWAVAVPLSGFAAFIFDGIFVGMVKTRAMLASMAAALGIFAAVYILCHKSLGNAGLWLAFNIYLATRGIILHIIFKNIPRTA